MVGSSNPAQELRKSNRIKPQKSGQIANEAHQVCQNIHQQQYSAMLMWLRDQVSPAHGDGQHPSSR